MANMRRHEISKRSGNAVIISSFAVTRPPSNMRFQRPHFASPSRPSGCTTPHPPATQLYIQWSWHASSICSRMSREKKGTSPVDSLAFARINHDRMERACPRPSHFWKHLLSLVGWLVCLVHFVRWNEGYENVNPFNQQSKWYSTYLGNL